MNERLKSYRVIIYYRMRTEVDIIANSQKEAKQKAQTRISNLTEIKNLDYEKMDKIKIIWGIPLRNHQA